MQLSNDELKRYNRHIILQEIGKVGQEKLKSAKVLVAGCGGLGCPVLLYLAAAGIGNLGLVDFDTVSESNLQRQILYSAEDIGKSKVAVAKQKLEKQNPFINVNAYNLKLDKTNVLDLLNNYDIIVDGTDNFSSRYLLNDACVMLGKPLVSGSVFKFEGQVTVFNFQDGPTYRCLYPEPPAPGEMPSCNDIGVVGVIPGIIGLLQANEVIKIMIGAGEILSGKLLTIDALSMQFNLFSFETDSKNKTIETLKEYDELCGLNIKEITKDELQQMIERKVNFQLIDVREPDEYKEKNIGGELIPLKTLTDNIHRFSKDKTIIVHCRSGERSKKAIQILLQNGFQNVYNLKNGLQDF